MPTRTPFKAILFDTGGTVLDWHGSIVDELGAVASWQGLAVDRHAFVNEWRRRTMRGIVGQIRPTFHMDDVHRSTLHDTVAHFALPPLAATDHDALCLAWHRLRAWPDFPPALTRLRAGRWSRSRCCRWPLSSTSRGATRWAGMPSCPAR